MPRRARLSVAGVPWHIIQRGNNRGACFFADDDYYCYLHWLRKAAEDHGVAVHAYVLMTPGGHFKFPHLWPGQIPPGATAGA